MDDLQFGFSVFIEPTFPLPPTIYLKKKIKYLIVFTMLHACIGMKMLANAVRVCALLVFTTFGS